MVPGGGKRPLTSTGKPNKSRTPILNTKKPLGVSLAAFLLGFVHTSMLFNPLNPYLYGLQYFPRPLAIDYGLIETPWGSAVEPVTSEDLASHLRLNDDSESALLTLWITAARQLFERVCLRSIRTTTLTATFAYWPAFLPRPPLIEVTGFQYLDASNTWKDLDEAQYSIDASLEPAMVHYGTNLPALGTDFPKVKVTYSAGYEDCPEVLRQAIKLAAADYYLQRQGSLPTLGALRAVPMGLQTIIDHYRVYF